ncbi:glycosyltransferase family 2 protein [Flavobacterium sp. 7A]|uniref:glycosyltransferase family 2 protein n=1 Tax=Flavobacterium sp. 7A TaxID=2940571 RepID=UPI0022266B0B|nr:glycosyltransferase family 2 protein [Flavobacterium sp. 7A]MCW2119416.1 glycosyltransferase involved in cell wall biosynthesis [Flavobacterium sp. 7A]
MLLSIVTATYNRAYCLSNIYISLLTNSRADFEWIIVDDGSTDGTESLIQEWIIENKINIRYVKQVNGGKTRAIFRGFQENLKGDFTLVLDSDDFLEYSLLNKIREELLNLDYNCIGVIGLKSDLSGKLIGSEFPCKQSSYINLYYGKNLVLGDKLFIIKTDLYVNSYSLPYDNEKFMPDNVPYINLNHLGLFNCMNIIFYRGDYLKDGMTANVMKMAMNNIKGFIYEKKILQKQKLYFRIKVLNNVKFIHYSLIDRQPFKVIVNNSDNIIFTILLYIPTFILTKKYRLETLKYKNNI